MKTIIFAIMFGFLQSVSAQINIDNLSGYWISKSDSSKTVFFKIRVTEKFNSNSYCPDSLTALNGEFVLRNHKTEAFYFFICNTKFSELLCFDAYGNGPFSYQLLKLTTNELVIEIDKEIYYFNRVKKREYKKQFKYKNIIVSDSVKVNVIDYN